MQTKQKSVIFNIRKLFHEKLQEKTNWGRNDVIKMFDTSVTEVMIKLAEDNNLI